MWLNKKKDDGKDSDGESEKKVEVDAILAPFNPTPDEAIDIALKLLSPFSDRDVLFELGCGDARYSPFLFFLTQHVPQSSLTTRVDLLSFLSFSVRAAQSAILRRVVGVEFDGKFVKRARRRAAEAGVWSSGGKSSQNGAMQSQRQAALCEDAKHGRKTSVVEIIHGDVCKVDFSEATCIFL